VMPFVTTNEFREASEPDVIIFFQFGIYTFIMVGYTEYAVSTSLLSL
jgi:hypothetical protein